MENKGNLINYPEIFTDDGKLLKDYVSIRKEIEEKGVKFNFKNNTSIYGEINQMRNALENYKNQNDKNEILKEDIFNTNEPNQNKFLNKGKRKREKDVKDNNEIEDNKNEENKTEDNNTHNKNKHYSPKSDEKRNKTRMERVNDAIKRISERFNITKESCLRKRNLMEILKKLNIKDPYFRIVSFLISYINIKI